MPTDRIATVPARHFRVWGLAAGVRTTAEAARGAFTWQDYSCDIPREDWLTIVIIEELA